MLGQSFAIFQKHILLAGRAFGTPGAVRISMLLQEVGSELVRVEEHKETDVAGEEAPEVTLNEMSPHLKTVGELLSAFITFCLLSLGRFGH